MSDTQTRTGDDAAPRPVEGGVAADRLLSIIERWEALDENVRALRSDQKDIMAEAKSAGFDVKVIRQILGRRKVERAEVEEQDALLEAYERAVGAA